MLETFVMQTQIFQSIHIIAPDADFILDFFLNFISISGYWFP